MWSRMAKENGENNLVLIISFFFFLPFKVFGLIEIFFSISEVKDLKALSKLSVVVIYQLARGIYIACSALLDF